MQSGVVTVIEAGLGAAGTAVVSLAVAYRRASGSVKHTSAERLWDAQEKLRIDLIAELDRKDQAMGEAERKCKEDIDNLRRQVSQLRRDLQ